MGPDEIQAWVILATSTTTGLIAAGTLVYSRIHRTRLDEEAIRAIHEANLAAIRARQPVPYPAFLPAGVPAPKG